jgi:hypothetical protein
MTGLPDTSIFKSPQPDWFAIGPALFPSVGSPNPMLTGIALARSFGGPAGDTSSGQIASK